MRFRALSLAFAAVAFVPVVRQGVREYMEARNMPSNCAPVANADRLQRSVLPAFQDLSFLQQLPVTGHAVRSTVADPDHGVRACHVETSRVVGAFLRATKTIKLGAGTGTTVAVHEYFHAHQHIVSENMDMTRLSIRDYGFSALLLEASAVAYQLATFKEAGLRQVPYYKDKKYTYAANSADVQRVFDAAYTKAWDRNAALPENRRLEKALSGGGKAVVRHLLSGREAGWTRHYKENAMKQTNFSEADFARESDPDTRRGYYAALGYVSSGINFTPDEFLGKNTERNISAAMARLGIVVRPRASQPSS